MPWNCPWKAVRLPHAVPQRVLLISWRVRGQGAACTAQKKRRRTQGIKNQSAQWSFYYIHSVYMVYRAIVVAVVLLLLDVVEAVQCSSSVGNVHVQPLETHTALEGDASQQAVGSLLGLSGSLSSSFRLWLRLRTNSAIWQWQFDLFASLIKSFALFVLARPQ